MIFLLLFFSILSYAQDFSQKTFTTGVRSSYFLVSNEWDNTFMYYIPEYSDETFGNSVGLRRKFKLRVFDYVSSNEKVIVFTSIAIGLSHSTEWKPAATMHIL